MSDSQGSSGRDPRAADWCEDRLSVSDQCELLANPRRRAVLRYLVTRSAESVSVEDLSEYVLAEEGGRTRRDVTFSLCHLHLPKLADQGIIDFDPERRRVRYRAHTELERHLAFLEGL